MSCFSSARVSVLLLGFSLKLRAYTNLPLGKKWPYRRRKDQKFMVSRYRSYST